MKILIIEDEDRAARQLIGLLNHCIANPEYLGVIDSVEEAVQRLRQKPIADLLFVDINLCDGSCFEIFNTVPVTMPVIFTTAHDQYAIQAFGVNSIDYLLKPVRKERLQQALDKYSRLSMHKRIPYKQHFLVAYKDRLIPVTASDFAWFEIDNGVVHGITFGEKKWVLNETLDELADTLHPERFYRANRQFLISRKAIKEVEFYYNGRLCIHLSPPSAKLVLVSKEKAGQFKNWMTGL